MGRPKLTLCPEEPAGSQGQFRRNCGEDCVLCNRPKDGSLTSVELALLETLRRLMVPPELWHAIEQIPPEDTALGRAT
jgi:hypothetical protein